MPRPKADWRRSHLLTPAVLMGAVIAPDTERSPYLPRHWWVIMFETAAVLFCAAWATGKRRLLIGAWAAMTTVVAAWGLCFVLSGWRLVPLGFAGLIIYFSVAWLQWVLWGKT